MFSAGRYVRAPTGSGHWTISEEEEEIRDQTEPVAANAQNDDTDPPRAKGPLVNIEANKTGREDNRAFMERLNQFEGALNQIQEMFAANQPGHYDLPPREESWSHNARGQSMTSGINLRFESIQPFPEDVPGNQMWAEWNKFIDRFEISVSVANVDDQVKRAQMLFLAMGPKLQGIITAGRLRPSLQDPNAYDRFVHNVERYLHSMIDLDAEHVAFQSLKQGPDEPTVAFHARLMEKARLCRYNKVDQDRFVRSQLLAGMSNQGVADMCHNLSMSTASILQMAGRTETRAKKSTPAESEEKLPQAFAVEQRSQRWRAPDSRFEAAGVRKSPKRLEEVNGRSWPYYESGSGREDFRREKRKHEGVYDQRKRAVGHRDNEGGYRNVQRDGRNGRDREQDRCGRCSRCNKSYHKFGICPALERKCLSCGDVGHFASVCRAKQEANNVEHSGWTDDEDSKVIKK